MSTLDNLPIGPNPCHECGGEYGEHVAGCSFAASHGSPSALVELLAAIERAQTESLRASSAEIHKGHRNHNRYLLRLSRRLGEMADEVARLIAPEENVRISDREGETL